MFSYIRKSSQSLLSPDAWKIRILFWSGAVIVGLVATGFALSTEFVDHSFHQLVQTSPYLPLVICPLGLMLVSWLTRRFFPGSQGSGVLLTAVFIAGITAISIQGNYTYFGSTDASLATSQFLLPIIVCGVVGGLLGGLFSTLLIQGSRRIAPLIQRRPLAIAAVCGLGIAIVGLLSGNTVYGTGYEEAQALITGTSTAPDGYPAYKMLATVFSYLSGIPGGIFAPSLATGAGVGTELSHWLPGIPAAAIVILGMVGYFTGVVQTPITAFVIVMEMTDNHDLLLPLMATAFVAYGTSRLVCPTPIYRILALGFLPVVHTQEAGEEKHKPDT